MIKFFRHIRQSLIMESKNSKYFKYAIGEIILVVIGILIALQINNWNEKRKSLNAESQLYLNIIEDLDKEHMVLKEQLDLSEMLKLNYRSIYEFGSGKTDSLQLDYPVLLFQSFNFSSIVIQNHENSVEKITSDSLRSQLNEYLLLAKELSTRRMEEVEEIKSMRRPYLMNNGIVDIDKMLYDSTEMSSVNLEGFKKIKNSREFNQFVASGYASNQALIFYTKGIIKQNRELKLNLENSKLLIND